MYFRLFKKYTSTLTLLLTSSFFCQATVLVQEDFAYPDGNLDGQNGGIGFTSPWSVSTTNSNGLLSSILNGAIYSNPDGVAGGNVNNDSTAERTFVAFSDDTLGINLDYNLIFDNENTYTYEFTILDSNGTEVLTAGISNDSYRVIFANGQTVSESVTTTFNDTLTLSLDFSEALSTLDIDSVAFTGLDTTTPLTSTTAFDFSSGGTIQINSAQLDQNGISIDNIILTVPEPSSLFLICTAFLLGVCRRNRVS